MSKHPLDPNMAFKSKSHNNNYKTTRLLIKQHSQVTWNTRYEIWDMRYANRATIYDWFWVYNLELIGMSSSRARLHKRGTFPGAPNNMLETNSHSKKLTRALNQRRGTPVRGPQVFSRSDKKKHGEIWLVAVGHSLCNPQPFLSLPAWDILTHPRTTQYPKRKWMVPNWGLQTAILERNIWGIIEDLEFRAWNRFRSNTFSCR